jgi:hypothetical protein
VPDVEVAAHEIDGVIPSRAREYGRIVACVAVNNVIPGPASNNVIAAAQRITAAEAVDDVCLARARNDIVAGIAIDPRRSGEDRDAWPRFD